MSCGQPVPGLSSGCRGWHSGLSLFRTVLQLPGWLFEYSTCQISSYVTSPLFKTLILTMMSKNTENRGNTRTTRDVTAESEGLLYYGS